jgi:MFS family permease
MRTFLTIWAGQLVSTIGTGLTIFTMSVWIYKQTGSVTNFALVNLVGMLPALFLAPFAGAYVDRWDRRWTMILSGAGAALSVLLLAMLLLAGRLALWHLIVIAAVVASLDTFQRPAYLASIRLLVPRERLARANGLLQLSTSLPMVFVPLGAGFLIAALGAGRVLLIDVASYGAALIALLAVRIPRPLARPAPAGKMAAGGRRRPSILDDVSFGWQYLVARPGLLGLMALFGVMSFCLAVINVSLQPMVLNFASTRILGVVAAVGNAGLLASSALLSALGGPQRRVLSILQGACLFGLGIVIAGLRPSPWTVAAGFFLASFGMPIMSNGSQVLWMSKTDPAVQGRVFALRSLVSSFTTPAGFVLAGPLIDELFEPLLAPGGKLAGSVGRFIGVGAGRGIGLLLVLLGFLPLAAAAAGYLYPRLRRLETELADTVVLKANAA